MVVCEMRLMRLSRMSDIMHGAGPSGSTKSPQPLLKQISVQRADWPSSSANSYHNLAWPTRIARDSALPCRVMNEPMRAAAPKPLPSKQHHVATDSLGA